MGAGPHWVLDAEGHPLPRNGGYFACYKPTGSKTFFANIVLPDGHKEKWDSHAKDRHAGIGLMRSYVRTLCRARGVPTLLETRRKAGELSRHQKTNANKAAYAAGQPIPYPGKGTDKLYPGSASAAPTPRRGRSPGSKNGTNGHTALAKGPMPLVPIVATPDEDSREWPGFQQRYAEKCVIFVARVTELLVLDGANNPELFLTNVRALLVDSIEGSIRKPRGRPPGP